MKTKDILLDAIADKLAGTGINKIVILFNIETDENVIMAKSYQDENIKIDITPSEITTLKKLFIRRIANKWNSGNKEKALTIAVEVELIKKELNLFVQTKLNGPMYKCEYL